MARGVICSVQEKLLTGLSVARREARTERYPCTIGTHGEFVPIIHDVHVSLDQQS